MRIVHCLRAPVGGLFRHVLDLAREQAKLGHDVGIIADANADDILTSQKFDAIGDVLTLGVTRIAMRRQPGIGDVDAARAVVRHVRDLQLDVLHGHGAKGGAYARLARRSLRQLGQPVRAIYTPHGGTLNLPTGSAVTTLYSTFERILERHSDGIIFESAFAQRAYSAQIGVPRCPARVIHNGLAEADFIPTSLAPDATDLVFIGELRDLKGVHVLLDAIASLRQTRLVTATIVGAGPDAAKLKAQCTALGLDIQVRFTGAMPARTAFTLGRILTVPSLKESFPYIVLEGAAAGKPLIATRVGGIPEIGGDDLPLIEPGSSDQLRDAILRLLSSPDIANARAQRLQDRVGAQFTVSAMTNAVLAFYGCSRARCSAA